MTPATKSGFDPHDASTCTPISDWQDRGDRSVHCPLQLCSQGSEVRLDLAQLMLLYRATRALPAPTSPEVPRSWRLPIPGTADSQLLVAGTGSGVGRSDGRTDGPTDRPSGSEVSPPALLLRTQNPPPSPRLPHMWAPHGEGLWQLRSGASASSGLKNQCK